MPDRFVLAVALSLALAAGIDAAPAPSVTKVEPPNWWVGHSTNPVRLLIRGRDLAGVRVEPGAAGLRAGTVKVNDAGTYAFVDVTIDADVAPGPRRLRLVTPGGAAEAAFEVLPPLATEGRFQGFSSDDVIYLLMPDRFANGDPANDDPPVSRGMADRGKSRYYHGGDLRGVIDHLPYLKDLGVTAIWTTPLYDNVNHLNERERYDDAAITDYHGYGAVDFYAVEEHFGTLATLRELVDKAHALGLKVIQDQVANHTGPYHPWVADPPTPTWFNGTAEHHPKNTWQTWSLFDPHAAPDVRRETLDGWFIDILPDLDQGDPEVARYLIQNALWWVGTAGYDGIRQDTLPYVPRTFWRDWSAALKRQHPHLRLLGEMFDGDPAMVSFFQGGRAGWDGIDTGIDTLFDFPLLYPVRRAFAGGQPLREVAVMLGHDALYPDPDRLVTFLGLHDLPRFMNEKGADRTGLGLAFTFLLTTRGIPMIYYGDEIGLAGGGDPDNRRDFPGGWQGDPRDAFTPAGRTPEEQALLEGVRRVARLRQEMPALRRGRLVHLSVAEQALAYGRVLPEGSVLVAINNGREPAELDVAAGPLAVRDGVVLEDRLGAVGTVTAASGRIRVRLPPRTAALFVPR